jgi:1-acyl-sn-glycerol-3-phosphate acyltransferase
MIYIRSFLTNVFYFGSLMIGCLLQLPLALLPQKVTIFFWDKIMMKIALFWVHLFAGIKFEIRGKENIQPKNVIYACKHESALETYAFTQFVPTVTYILKKELIYIPLFGWTQYFYGMIPVDRKGGARAMKNMLQEVKKRTDKGRPVVIFPEGTRCRPGTTKGYKSGIMFLAENLNLPVVPVAINTGFFWAKNSFLRHTGTAVFEFLPAISAEGKTKEQFMHELENAIESKCKQLNQETMEKYPHLAHICQTSENQ